MLSIMASLPKLKLLPPEQKTFSAEKELPLLFRFLTAQTIKVLLRLLLPRLVCRTRCFRVHLLLLLLWAVVSIVPATVVLRVFEAGVAIGARIVIGGGVIGVGVMIGVRIVGVVRPVGVVVIPGATFPVPVLVINPLMTVR